MGSPVPTDDVLIAELHAFIPEVLRVTKTPGLTVAVARRGRVIYEAGFGYADLGTEVPMAPSSVFPAGSITKLYTAVAVMQLVERGRVDLHAPAAGYLDGLRLQNPLGEREVTVYDLLTHRSGLADEAIDCQTDLPGPVAAYLADAYATDRRREYHSFLSRWSAKVGERFQYSSLGIATLGRIVETSGGRSYPDYVHEQILAPLGMESSYFATSEEAEACRSRLEPLVASGYGLFGSTLVPTLIVHAQGVPAAGLRTTAGDHARLLMALLNGGALGAVRILSPDTVALMLTPQTASTTISQDGAMWQGLGVQTDRGHPGYFGHLGAHPWGWYHDSRGYPALDAAVVVLTNRFDVSRWDNAPAEIAPGVIADFVASLMSSDARVSPADTQRASWGYKEAFMMGLLLAERTNGMLGITSEISDAELQRVAAGARPASRPDDAWSPEGFEAGVRALRGASMTPRELASYMADLKTPILSAELSLMALRFGRRGRFPVPHRHFASAPAG
jgi:CubicO group peptidase (beta-lactamase class C family)